jgi:DsbC/DsbD-like thiol-disulfide interchange protein
MMNMSFPVALPVALAAAAVLAAADPVLSGPDFPEPTVSLLVPGGPPADGVYDVGVAFDLPDGWHTYWRTPGDAGLPPQFDTSASRNLSSFEVAWPAPERYLEGDLVSVVYEHDPVLPVRVTAADPAEPTDLVVDLSFGYCREVCIPATARLEATIDPLAPVDAAAAEAVARARALVPVAEADAPAGAPTIAALERVGEDRKTAVLRITVAGGDPAALDLFAEPPDGWYLTQPRRVAGDATAAVFELPLRGMPRKAGFAGATFRYTIVDPSGSVERVRTLD